MSQLTTDVMNEIKTRQNEFILRLQEYVETSGWSGHELADIDHSHISLILNQQLLPSRDVIISLGIALRLDLLDIDELLLLAD